MAWAAGSLAGFSRFESRAMGARRRVWTSFGLTSPRGPRDAAFGCSTAPPFACAHLSKPLPVPCFRPGVLLLLPRPAYTAALRTTRLRRSLTFCQAKCSDTDLLSAQTKATRTALSVPRASKDFFPAAQSQAPLVLDPRRLYPDRRRHVGGRARAAPRVRRSPARSPHSCAAVVQRASVRSPSGLASARCADEKPTEINQSESSTTTSKSSN
mmetsp:Transcript_6645/g.16297  ORF Transcript_6645/g.16297 Transcript_6645/m.16297 type:complete len:212 (+) Transcript_6645:4165-4800(+)